MDIVKKTGNRIKQDGSVKSEADTSSPNNI